MDGVLKEEEDEKPFHYLFQFALLLSSCPGVKMILFIVFCQVKAYGGHLYIIICWRTGCPEVGVLFHTLGIAVIGIVGQCDTSDNGYHGSEVTYSILGAWRRYTYPLEPCKRCNILIRVSQKTQSQFSLVGPYIWKSLGRKRVVLTRLRESQGRAQVSAACGELGECVGVPGSSASRSML